MNVAENLERALRPLASGLRPRSRLPVSEWAETHRILPLTSMESGRWRNKRTPYLREIMDALGEANSAKVVVFCKSVQIGGSEAGYNALGTWITESPANIILAMPTEDMHRKVSRQRIRPMLEDCEVFTGKISTRRDGQGATSSNIPFPGGSLSLVSAKSGASLRQTNARYLVLDETDGYPDSLPGEGSPVSLLMARTTTFGFNYKVLMTSTPAGDFETSNIWRYYQLTDRRKYFVPCPHCDFMQALEWENLIYDPAMPEAAKMQCVKCKKKFEDGDKDDFLPRGEWRAEGKTSREGYIGFHLNSLYSPHGWLSWGQLAAERVAAEKNPTLMNAFTNAKLALPYKQTAYTPQFKTKECQINLGAATAPEDTCAITAGIDTQTDCVHIYVFGWRPGEKPFVLDKLIVSGNLVNDRFWRKVYLAINHLEYKTKSGRSLIIDCAAIDSGGDHTSDVYRFVKNARVTPGRRNQIIAIKGVGGWDKPIITLGGVKGRGSRVVRDVEFFRVGVDRCKHWLYRKIENNEFSAPAKWASGERVKMAYFNEVVAEEETWIPRAGGDKLMYVPKPGIPNEALDCAVYAFAALRHLAVRWDLAEKMLENWQKKIAKKGEKKGKKG